MSREIKFRGKSIDSSRWFYGYYLAYHVTGGGKLFHYIKNPNITVEIDPETLGQFTGRYDKNGKEIYEWDAVSWSAWKLDSCYEKSCKKKVNIVEWSVNKGKWFIGNDLWDLGIYSDIEVIGNIHENPELLEEGND